MERRLSRMVSFHGHLLVCTLTFAHAAMALEADPNVQAVLDRHVVKESATPISEHPGWKKPERIAIYAPPTYTELKPDYKEWLQEVAGGAQLVFAESFAELRDAARDADVVLGTCAVLSQPLPRLRWVQRYGVGVDTCLGQTALADPHVLLTNTRGLSGPYIAEHVIAMTMMLSHGMHHYYRQQLDKTWQRPTGKDFAIRPVAGKTMLVAGLGGIGTKVAEKAAALGMRVTAVRNSSRDGPAFVDYVGLSHELMDLALEADFVVNTLPLTTKTTGLYDKAFFTAMKKSAYFISVGRGKSVVTEDLLAALDGGEIAGAGLDVTDPEPLPPTHPLWEAPNVLITPHSSSRSGAGAPETLIFVRENLRRYTAGEPMLNVVDRELEY